MNKKMRELLAKIAQKRMNARDCMDGENKDLEKAKGAVSIRNEWIGWGNVNKKNVYMLDYEYLKKQIEGDSQIYIF